MAPSAQFEVSPPPGDAVSSLSFAPGTSTRLLASCWDKSVYLYDLSDSNEGTLVQTFEQQSPVLAVCFGKDDSEAYSAGLDHTVQRIDLTSGEQQVIGQHEQGASCVAYSPEHNLIVSGSWDATIHFHDANDLARGPIKIQLPGKVHALATSPTKVVVAMTARLVHIYDLPTVAAYFEAHPSNGSGDLTGTEASIQPWQQRESSLKFLTRAVACMPNDAGYATSSIEGRVAVEWFDDSAESQARKYAFRCHRQAAPEEEGGGDIVYPVNALAFHPKYGTFASGGGDGTVALWDAEAKRRMKQYQKIPNSVWALAFSTNGKYLAMGVAPGFETGQEDYSGSGKTQIIVRELSETEAKSKGSK